MGKPGIQKTGFNRKEAKEIPRMAVGKSPRTTAKHVCRVTSTDWSPERMSPGG